MTDTPDKQPQEEQNFELPDDRAAQIKDNLIESWKSRPFIRITIIMLPILALAALAMGVFGGKSSEQVSQSLVGSSSREAFIPGDEVPKNYRKAVEAHNLQKADEAAKAGKSSLPTPLGSVRKGVSLEDINGDEKGNQDPLAKFRTKEKRKTKTKASTATPPPPPRIKRSTVTKKRSTSRTDSGQRARKRTGALDKAMADSMRKQMDGLFTGWKAGGKGVEIVSITPSDFYSAGIARAVPGAVPGVAVGMEEERAVAPSPRKTLIDAGTIVYGQTLIEANSDVPAPVLASVLTGVFTGARLIGNFDMNENHLVLRFSTLVHNGMEYSVEVLALDPATSLAGLATDVEHHYFKRVFLPGAAAFLSGISEAIAERDTTLSSGGGDVVFEEKKPLDADQKFAKGLSESGQVVANFIKREGDRVSKTIKVAAGTPMGLLFISSVKEKKNGQ